jgi:hypothetical protein
MTNTLNKCVGTADTLDEAITMAEAHAETFTENAKAFAEFAERVKSGGDHA